MKKVTCLALAISLLSLNVFAASEQSNPLVPANSMEEMMNVEAMEDGIAPLDFFNDHDRDHDRDHGRDHRRGRVECVARNLRGQRFEARGFYPREVQQDAMRACYRVSQRCFEMGCHRN